jgi:DNA-binding CsgD family transcriptional regulator
MNVDAPAFGSPGFTCLPGLTPREVEVVRWIGEGKRNAEIGVILGVSRRTVDKHVEHIFEKLGVETRTTAARVVFGIQ